MPVRSCLVSFVDSEGLRHSCEVQAETLFEAAGLAIGVFSEHECAPGLAANLEVEIRSSVIHSLSVSKVRQWVDGTSKSPKEAILKKRLRESME